MDQQDDSAILARDIIFALKVLTWLLAEARWYAMPARDHADGGQFPWEN